METPAEVLDRLTDHGFAPVTPDQIIRALGDAGYTIASPTEVTDRMVESAAAYLAKAGLLGAGHRPCSQSELLIVRTALCCALAARVLKEDQQMGAD